MSELRQKMIRAMDLSNLSDNTQRRYLDAVSGLAKHYHRSPDQLTKEMIEDYLLYLKNDKANAPNSCASTLSGLRFFYNHVAQQQILIEYSLSRKVQKLPTVLPQEDIWNIINATDNLKHRLILMTTYSAGLRSCEVRMLKPKNIESKKMLIKVEKGKGGSAIRYLPKCFSVNCEITTIYAGPKPTCFPPPISIINTSHYLTNRCAAFMKKPAKKPVLKMVPAFTPCDIRLQLICWRPATTSEKSRCSWATGDCPPP